MYAARPVPSVPTTADRVTDAPAARLGVVMLCHENLDLATRMARIWAEGGATVAIHVDAKAPEAAFATMRHTLAGCARVLFAPRRACEWGTFSLVAATQDTAQALLAADPDLTHVLTVSGACLPLRPVEELIEFLSARPDRDFIESVNASDVGWAIGGLDLERFTLRFPFSFRRQRSLFDRYVNLQRRLNLSRRIPEGVIPHLGSQWWCLTVRTLTAILSDPERGRYDRYFRHVWIPDESYFQTLARRHTLGIESRSLTLSKFDGQGKPYVFYDDHRDMLAQSGCFVARKIWPRAQGLYEAFPRPAQTAEPDSYMIDRLIDQAVARRKVGRPGLYMQSRFPRKDAENGKTAAPYTVLYGLAEAYPGLTEWLPFHVDADVHGHLFAETGVEFSGGRRLGPGCLSGSAAMRNLDPQGFLTSLIRVTKRRQMFQFSPRDDQQLNWFMGTDPNMRLLVITGAWAVPLLHSGMPFDDVRRAAAILQRRELDFLNILDSVWLKAQVSRWNLAEIGADPLPPLATLLETDDLPDGAPAPADLTGMLAFLDRLRNAGLRPRKMGDFRHPERSARPPIIKDAS